VVSTKLITLESYLVFLFCIKESLKRPIAISWKTCNKNFPIRNGKTYLLKGDLLFANLFLQLFLYTLCSPFSYQNLSAMRLRKLVIDSYNGQWWKWLDLFYQMAINLSGQDRWRVRYKSIHLMNKAFIMKFRWGITNDNSSLWARVLHRKYIKTTDNIPRVQARGKDSPKWKAIWKVCPWVISGIDWSIWSVNKISI